jgi:hypothetical protein
MTGKSEVVLKKIFKSVTKQHITIKLITYVRLITEGTTR